MCGNSISWAICKSAPRSRQITMPAPHHSVFYRSDALPATQPTASKHWRHAVLNNNDNNYACCDSDLYFQDDACNCTLHNVGSVKTVDAVSAEYAALLTDCSTAVHPEQEQHTTHTQFSFTTDLITYTHTRLTALCPRPIWILLKQETVSGNGISWVICKSAPRSRQITTPAPHHSVFAGRMPFLSPNQQRQSTEGITKGLSTREKRINTI